MADVMALEASVDEQARIKRAEEERHRQTFDKDDFTRY